MLADSCFQLRFYKLAENNISMENIRVKEHTITAFGGFKNETSINFSQKGVSIILGINGAGKTTILNSLYFSIANSLSNIIAASHRDIGIIASAISIGRTESIVRTIISHRDNDFELGYRFLLNGQIQVIGVGLNQIRTNILNNYKDSEYGILPVYRYFQTEKSISNSIVTNQTFNKLENRSIGYEKHQSKSILIQEITGFLINQINIENQAKVEKKDLNFETPIAKYLRETLNEFTSILYGDKVHVKVGASKYSSGQSLIFSKNDQEIEFLQLSSGEKYALSIVLEIIYRAANLNPRLYDLKYVPGIILIDEVESHLHPSWQLTILSSLEICFPNIQFIVSTHSPLVASTVKREQIIALNNYEIIPSDSIPDVYSGTADELLNKVLYTSNHIGTFDDKKSEILKLINKLDFDQAEEKLKNLKLDVGAAPQWISDLERKISFGKA